MSGGGGGGAIAPCTPWIGHSTITVITLYLRVRDLTGVKALRHVYCMLTCCLHPTVTMSTVALYLGRTMKELNGMAAEIPRINSAKL